MPSVRGTIDRHPRGGSRIRGTITPHPFTLVFLVFWSSIMLFVVFGETDNGIAPVVMLGGVWAISTVAFFAEVRKARAFLVEIFEVASPEDGV